MKEVKAFLTSDGKIFVNEDEAKIHEEFLNINPIIEAFLSSTANPYHGFTQRAIVRRAIASWEQWRSENV